MSSLLLCVALWMFQAALSVIRTRSRPKLVSSSDASLVGFSSAYLCEKAWSLEHKDFIPLLGMHSQSCCIQASDYDRG
ncbi:uncharacterized protein LY89DRAFT_680282 [Mollisia scopiformis]|uniref:Secreted protein n=1 Tax=Mollisia scopiformis TaxID=149040 RepID=A0A194XTK6_MOLSC|nr:uncharacterized protein LY89DRAFT_680282 [Mollisia scopiformis]KUJ23543.1 hypothetical protein LY89DRAFT_680282 [Mollisia scopiformis]